MSDIFKIPRRKTSNLRHKINMLENTLKITYKLYE